MSMEEVLSQIDGYVHDKKHFSARYLAKMSEMSGHPVDQVRSSSSCPLILLRLLNTSSAS